jgi:hypothetical protein
MLFLRFQTALRCLRTGRWLGIFGASYWLIEGKVLLDAEEASLQSDLAWFSSHLPSPKLGIHGWKAMFWFRDNAATLPRVWNIVHPLRNHGIHVELIATQRPGKVVYRDEHQVAAIPHAWRRRRRCRSRIRIYGKRRLEGGRTK